MSILNIYHSLPTPEEQKQEQRHNTSQHIMARRRLEHHVIIVLDEGEDERAIPDVFRRFIMQLLA
jgi:hypothetical protein